ncbi:hypothetical protein [uncultured Microscilla sp.]|uniref:calcium-binding protein n=1 Tax=uncultured Microscilla sp. TaxID=432653 RepID=UPI00262FB6CC|nr:hypothetical protein [uncultured Microscilla sp.]
MKKVSLILLLIVAMTGYSCSNQEKVEPSKQAGVTADIKNAVIPGTSGNNTLYGTSGGDTMYGYAGNDVMYGGGGNDVLYGGKGNDRLYGDAGRDNIYGQDGDDNIYYRAGVDGVDGRMDGGSGNDAIYITGNISQTDVAVINNWKQIYVNGQKVMTYGYIERFYVNGQQILPINVY